MAGFVPSLRLLQEGGQAELQHRAAEAAPSGRRGGVGGQATALLGRGWSQYRSLHLLGVRTRRQKSFHWEKNRGSQLDLRLQWGCLGGGKDGDTCLSYSRLVVSPGGLKGEGLMSYGKGVRETHLLS